MGNGPLTPIFWSIALGMITVKCYSWYRPFVEDSDDTLAEVISWVCLLVFVGTLAACVEALDGALGEIAAFAEQEPLKAIFVLTLFTSLLLFKLNKMRLRAAATAAKCS